MQSLEADYLVIGTGAVGMAFVDTLLDESDASVIMVDNHHAPGGHWNDAYPFVRLHQPSHFYGGPRRLWVPNLSIKPVPTKGTTSSRQDRRCRLISSRLCVRDSYLQAACGISPCVSLKETERLEILFPASAIR